MVVFAVLVYVVALVGCVVAWVSMGMTLGALAVVMVAGSIAVSAMLSAAVVVCAVVAVGRKLASIRL